MDVGGVPYNIPGISYLTSEASDGFDMLDLNQNERPMTVSVKNEKCDTLLNESDRLTVYDAQKQISKCNMHAVDDVFLQIKTQGNTNITSRNTWSIITLYTLKTSNVDFCRFSLCYCFVSPGWWADKWVVGGCVLGKNKAKLNFS